MTGQYPRATSTFIQRDVAGLRRNGVHVETIAARPPAAHEYVGAEQQAERDRTYYLLPPNPLKLLKAHARLLLTGPGRYFSAMRLALRTRSPGVKALVWQFAYFAEAGLVADRMRQRGLTHLHNNFADSSCSVAMLAAAVGGFEFSFTMHGPTEFFEPYRWRLDEKIRRAKFVSCISHFCRSQAMVFSPPEAWEKIRIVHCGVDPDAYRPGRHEGRGWRVLFVGRLAAVKGLPVLLEAAAQLTPSHPDLQLTLAGDGPDLKLIKAMIERLGLSGHARILGYQSEEQVSRLLGEHDVFAMASFAEGVPVVLMEAMAAGVPVVAPHIAGIPELIDDGRNGFLVPPGDPAALAARVHELLEDAALRTRLAAAGRLKVENDFNLRTECDRFHRILTSLVGGSANAADLAAQTQAAGPVGPAACAD